MLKTKTLPKDRTAISLDKDIFRRAKEKCAKSGAKLSSIIEILLRAWLDKK